MKFTFLLLLLLLSIYAYCVIFCSILLGYYIKTLKKYFIKIDLTINPLTSVFTGSMTGPILRTLAISNNG